MLIQLHHQFKDGHTEMCVQREVVSISDIEQFVKDTWKSHPPRKGAQFLAVTEKSKHFVWTEKTEK